MRQVNTERNFPIKLVFSDSKKIFNNVIDFFFFFLEGFFGRKTNQQKELINNDTTGPPIYRRDIKDFLFMTNQKRPFSLFLVKRGRY